MRSRRLAILSFAALLAACGGPEIYREQIELVKRHQDRQEEASRAADQQFAAMAARCPENDGSCVLGIAMARAFTLRDAASDRLQLPAPPRSGWEIVADVAKAVAPPLIGGAVAWRQSDNSVRVSERQFEFYSSAFGAMRDVATSAQPNIHVGGNWGDTSSSSTSYGDDYTGGNRSDTRNSGTLISGDGNRTTIGDRNHNRGRQDSPGPIDNSDNSSTNPPPPAPPPDDGGGDALSCDGVGFGPLHPDC